MPLTKSTIFATLLTFLSCLVVDLVDLGALQMNTIHVTGIVFALCIAIDLLTGNTE